jgi:hypothetical protein
MSNDDSKALPHVGPEVPIHSVVELERKGGTINERVVVGIAIKPGNTTPRNYFQWADKHALYLRPARPKGVKKSNVKPTVDFITAMLSCGVGLGSFRSQYPHEFDCEFTTLKGFDLSDNWTVGMIYATFYALSQATQFQPKRILDEMKASGWHVRKTA